MPVPPRRHRAAPHLYLLGDNHAGSYDSRGFGPIPMSDVVGHVRTTIPSPRTLALCAAALAVVLLAGPAALRRLRRIRPRCSRLDDADRGSADERRDVLDDLVGEAEGALTGHEADVGRGDDARSRFLRSVMAGRSPERSSR